MSTRIILASVLVVAVAVLGYAFFSINSHPAVSTTTPPTPSAEQTQTASSTSSAEGYTLAQVAQHNSASDCWAAINGNVYNLTSWISQHPGGPEHIIPLCGTDGSAAFNAQHGGQGGPAQELVQFYVGTLAQ